MWMGSVHTGGHILATSIPPRLVIGRAGNLRCEYHHCVLSRHLWYKRYLQQGNDASGNVRFNQRTVDMCALHDHKGQDAPFDADHTRLSIPPFDRNHDTWTNTI